MMLSIVLASALGAAQPGAHPTGCLRALSAITRDAVPVGEEFVTTACPPGQNIPAAFRYDAATRTSRAIRNFAAGDIIPPFVGCSQPAFNPGQRLQFVVRVGDVTIARAVEALQRGEPGQKLFVRTSDGTVFSVAYESLMP